MLSFYLCTRLHSRWQYCEGIIERKNKINVPEKRLDDKDLRNWKNARRWKALQFNSVKFLLSFTRRYQGNYNGYLSSQTGNCVCQRAYPRRWTLWNLVTYRRKMLIISFNSIKTIKQRTILCYYSVQLCYCSKMVLPTSSRVTCNTSVVILPKSLWRLHCSIREKSNKYDDSCSKCPVVYFQDEYYDGCKRSCFVVLLDSKITTVCRHTYVCILS